MTSALDRHHMIPTLGTLQRVVPVAQSQTHRDLSVTLPSLELYDDGFLTIVRLRYPDDRATGWLRFSIVATDDLQTTYTAYHFGGGGGGQSGYASWRGEYIFAPAIHPEARWLQLEIPEIEFMTHPRRFVERPHPARRLLRIRRRRWLAPVLPQGHEPVVERQVGGPWTFRVPLD